MKTKKFRKRLLTVFGIIAILVITLIFVYKLNFDPYRGTVSTFHTSKDLYSSMKKEDAIADLNFVSNILLERHPACMEGLPDKVRSQLEKEKSDMPEETTVLQVWQAIARILARLGDAHTNIRFNGIDNRILPLKFEMLNNKLYCTSEGYQNATVISINDIPVEILHDKFLDQFSYEIEGYGTYLFAKTLSYAIYLDFIGVNTDSDINIKFQTKEKEWIETLSFSTSVQETKTQDTPFVSYRIDENNNLGILILRSCNFNDYYRNTVKEFFTEIKEYKIENIAVDLRYNGGGNSQVINEFLRYLDLDEYYIIGGMDARYGPILYHFKKQIIKNKKVLDLLFAGKVFALTSTNSFSSAEMFANTLQDNNIGQIIGEIPGNMPASYGDILTFQTPNSKLVFSVSYKYFQRIDETKSELPLIPDYEVKAVDAEKKLYEIIGQ